MDVLISPRKEKFVVLPRKDGDTLFAAELELKDTGSGARPSKFRVRDGEDGFTDVRQPDEFLDLAKMAGGIVVPDDIKVSEAARLEGMMDAFQLNLDTIEVCRFCLLENCFTEIGEGRRVRFNGEYICPDCGKRELDREISYKGDLSRKVRDRLKQLLLRVGDVEKLVGLLNASLDPELTKYDTVSETSGIGDSVSVDDLSLHPGLRDAVGFEELLPVQSLSVREGLMDGRDQLVVSATATGKTLIGELAGIQNALDGEGKTLFLVPLVALANQKYSRFRERYQGLVDVTEKVGSNRIYGGKDEFDPDADVVVGTYEGVDHMLRSGKGLGDVGTVVIDEVHNLEDEDRGHGLDGLITRLKNSVSGGQWIYLSATVGNPRELSRSLDAELVEYEERPVPIDRHLTFVGEFDKSDVIDRLVKREYNRKSSKGYRGQTIVFTNSRRRCEELAGTVDLSSAAYHAGLSGGKRKDVERRFNDGKIAAVFTTAALGAGVDFPASQVIFERLAMGIEWLTVQEFEQMLGRAGRPDYHDRGVVYILAEPDATYHSSLERTEDEVALDLLDGEMGGVGVEYDLSDAVEETLANICVAGTDYSELNDSLLGRPRTGDALSELRELGLVRGEEVTRLGLIACLHFMSLDEIRVVVEGVEGGRSPYGIVAGLEGLEE
ncbi:MAG: DEAD/DEAH box helicase [Halobacteria archaeon]